jgi:hypothetical protein
MERVINAIPKNDFSLEIEFNTGEKRRFDARPYLDRGITVKPDFELLLEFENGEHRRFNMATYIDQKPWVRLKSSNTFLGAFLENGFSGPGVKANFLNMMKIITRNIPLPLLLQ